jgi:hypothetical protein
VLARSDTILANGCEQTKAVSPAMNTVFFIFTDAEYRIIAIGIRTVSEKRHMCRIGRICPVVGSSSGTLLFPLAGRVSEGARVDGPANLPHHATFKTSAQCLPLNQWNETRLFSACTAFLRTTEFFAICKH